MVSQFFLNYSLRCKWYSKETERLAEHGLNPVDGSTGPCLSGHAGTRLGDRKKKDMPAQVPPSGA